MAAGPQRDGHRQRRVTPEGARLVGGGRDDAPSTIRSHQDGLAAPLRVVALLHGCIEGVHVDVEDDAFGGHGDHPMLGDSPSAPRRCQQGDGDGWRRRRRRRDGRSPPRRRPPDHGPGSRGMPTPGAGLRRDRPHAARAPGGGGRTAVRVLELSLEEASGLGQDRITSAHLLLGLLRTPDGVAGRALAALGVGPDRARESLR